MPQAIGLIFAKNRDTSTPIAVLADNLGQLRVVLAAEVGGEVQVLEVDEITNALVTIAVPHHEVHEGESFQSSYKSPDASAIVDNANIEIFLITGATKEVHLTYAVSGGGDTEVELREAVAVSDNGTALAESNMKRSSAETAEMQAFHTPTIIGQGTRFVDVFLPGGTGGNSAGGLLRADTEWILAVNRTYLVRGINRAGNAQPMSLLVQWYEETP